MIRITFACPEAFIPDANQLARVVGYSEADERTYGVPQYQDAEGNRYAVASGLVVPHFAEVTMAPLVEPEWGADMEGARRAQALAALGQPASPDHIAAVPGDDVQATLSFMGLVPVAQFEDSEA